MVIININRIVYGYYPLITVFSGNLYQTRNPIICPIRDDNSLI